MCFADDSEDDDDEEEEYDLFGRLEESRCQLEADLGCQRFLQVYKAVQVRHIPFITDADRLSITDQNQVMRCSSYATLL